MKRVTNNGARGPIANREEFDNGRQSFWGREHTPGSYVYTGHLSGRRPESTTVSSADYIVFSYSTPIGWHIPGEGWVIPDVTYSVTTSRHQSITRGAVGPRYADAHLPVPWSLGLSRTAGELLDSIRYGNTIGLTGHRRSTLQAVVDTGEARWSPDGTAIESTHPNHAHLLGPR